MTRPSFLAPGKGCGRLVILSSSREFPFCAKAQYVWSAHHEWRGDGRHVRERLVGLLRREALDAYGQIEPCGLPGYRIGIGNPAAGFIRGQIFRDEVVEQEADTRFRCILVERPCTRTLADRIPRPDGVRIDPVHEARPAFELAVAALDPDPVLILDSQLHRNIAMQVNPVFRKDLAEPGILRAPRMVHRHRALSDRVERETLLVNECLFDRLVPDGKRLHETLAPLAHSPLRRDITV